MNHKVYIVKEYGGEDETYWEHIIGVCSSSELADYLKNKIEEAHNNSYKITHDRWMDMWDAVDNKDPWNDAPYELMHELFPEYSIREIKEASEIYDSFNSYVGVMVDEVNFYTNQSDILNNESNN